MIWSTSLQMLGRYLTFSISAGSLDEEEPEPEPEPEPEAGNEEHDLASDTSPPAPEQEQVLGFQRQSQELLQ